MRSCSSSTSSSPVVQLDPGANADYQRALDEYEAAKKAADTITEPEHVKIVTETLEDARYAMACVRARVDGQPLPTRRPPCFFDPRHGLSVEDVPYTPPGGATRDVPACILDAERIHAGAEPDIRKVMVGNRRVPYFQGGRAYQPYAAGYFGGFGPMDMMFMGMLFGGGFDGIGDGIGAHRGGSRRRDRLDRRRHRRDVRRHRRHVRRVRPLATPPGPRSARDLPGNRPSTVR